jgi:hypothetical protein
MGMAPSISDGRIDYSNLFIPTKVNIDEFGKYTIQRFNGADPLHLYEARSAIYWHKLLTRGGLASEKELVTMIRATELTTTNSYLPLAFEYHTKADDLVLYAAITSMFDQLVCVSSMELDFPEEFLRWLRVSSALVGRFIWIKHLERGPQLIDAFRRGLLPALLTEHLNSGVKWRGDYQGRPKVTPQMKM